ncbi:MAG TPA: hypothetical protein VIG99_30790 [Myxococcaceae bacterium]
MEPDFIAFQPTAERDPDGSKLRGVLSAHFTLERARVQRAVLVHWLAALGVLVWLAAARPGWLPAGAHRLLLAGWAVSAAAAAATILREWRWRVRRDAVVAGIRAELPRNT